MKRLSKSRILFFVCCFVSFCAPIRCHAQEETNAVPVYGTDIKDGSYEVTVESSSSMFRVVKAQLHVSGGNMTACLTLSGTGYLKLFMGTGEEALQSDEEDFIPYVEDAQGAYTYTIPVEAVNVEFACAAYSRRKEKWYDRQLVIPASCLPEAALAQEAQEPAAVKIQAADGDYTMEVTLSGGSGRAGVVSPARIRVSEGAAAAFLEWSSSDYDYMLVNGVQYFPVSDGGNSVFEIPVLALDKEMAVTADTTAMSRPHEIDYTLTFHSDTLKKAGAQEDTAAPWLLFGLAALLAAAAVYQRCRRAGG